jgi:hypothetical protein
MATNIEVNEPEPEGDVLAEAAVASAALAGAAHANAEHALMDVEEVEESADEARALAEVAIMETHERPTYDDTSEMIDRRLEEFGAKLLAVIEGAMAPKTEAVEVVEEVPEEVKPKSVAKAEKKKKKSWAERYMGIGDSDE